MFPSDKTGRVCIQTYRLKIMGLLNFCCKLQYECLTCVWRLRDKPFWIIWFLVDRPTQNVPLIVSLGKRSRPLSVFYGSDPAERQRSENPVCKPEENWFGIRAKAFECGLFLVTLLSAYTQGPPFFQSVYKSDFQRNNTTSQGTCSRKHI